MECATFESEIRSLQRKLAKRDAEIVRQERELHKLRVRSVTTKFEQISHKHLRHTHCTLINENFVQYGKHDALFQSVLNQASNIMNTGDDHLLTTIQVKRRRFFQFFDCSRRADFRSIIPWLDS